MLRKTKEAQCDVIWARMSITKEYDDDYDDNKRKEERKNKTDKES